MKRLMLLSLLCFSLILGGTASLHAAKTADEGFLLVAFGTSDKEALVAYEAIEKPFAAEGKPVVWAYTSDIIRKKLNKAGQKVLSINEAMDLLAKQGVKNLKVQSLHVMAGEEFSQLERTVLANMAQHPKRFSNVYLGRPLLESYQDMNEVIDALQQEFPKERKADEAIVLMGHGQHHGRADLVFGAVRSAFRDRDPLVFMGMVEGAYTFDQLLVDLKQSGAKRVWLQPFMIVAGDHAKNDLVGDEEDSWASQIKAAGMQVVPRVKGMGEIKGIPAIFHRHANAKDDNLISIKEAE